MAAVAHSPKVSFYPLPHLEGIEEERCICLNQLESNNSIVSNIWNNKEILIHNNDHTTKGYSCFIHRDCLKEWLATNPICPSCRSPVNSNSAYSWKDKAVTILCDGLEGGGKVLTVGFFVGASMCLGAAMQGPNVLQSFSTGMQQFATLQVVHQAALCIFTCGAVFVSSARYWFDKKVPLL